MEDELYGPEMGVEVGFWESWEEIPGEPGLAREDRSFNMVLGLFDRIRRWAKATHAFVYHPYVYISKPIDPLASPTLRVRGFFWRPT